jgi:hypothetical protein
MGPGVITSRTLAHMMGATSSAADVSFTLLSAYQGGAGLNARAGER